MQGVTWMYCNNFYIYKGHTDVWLHNLHDRNPYTLEKGHI